MVIWQTEGMSIDTNNKLARSSRRPIVLGFYDDPIRSMSLVDLDLRSGHGRSDLDIQSCSHMKRTTDPSWIGLVRRNSSEMYPE